MERPHPLRSAARAARYLMMLLRTIREGGQANENRKKPGMIFGEPGSGLRAATSF